MRSWNFCLVKPGFWVILITAIHLYQAVLLHWDSLPLQIDIDDVADNIRALTASSLMTEDSQPLQENGAVLVGMAAAVPEETLSLAPFC